MVTYLHDSTNHLLSTSNLAKPIPRHFWELIWHHLRSHPPPLHSPMLCTLSILAVAASLTHPQSCWWCSNPQRYQLHIPCCKNFSLYPETAHTQSYTDTPSYFAQVKATADQQDVTSPSTCHHIHQHKTPRNATQCKAWRARPFKGGGCHIKAKCNNQTNHLNK